jgi:thiol-disulfide isomerase/thioredoxin
MVSRSGFRSAAVVESGDDMRLKHLFALAAAPPLFCFLPLTTTSAAEPNATLLRSVKAQALPATSDQRLAEVLGRHQGKPVLVNFWATWCEPCREEMPSLAHFAARWQAKGLVVLTVAVADNAARVDDFLWEVLPTHQALPVLHDREQVISRAWGARVLPTSVVLDRRHRIVLRGQGAIDWDAPAIKEQLKPYLN